MKLSLATSKVAFVLTLAPASSASALGVGTARVRTLANGARAPVGGGE